MKMLLGAAAMVCVRMSIKESFNKGSALAVAFDAIPKILRYIAGVIVGVIGGRPNVSINKDGCSGLVSEADQRHVPVADRKVRASCRHMFSWNQLEFPGWPVQG